jgi:hypothetical protein
MLPVMAEDKTPSRLRELTDRLDALVAENRELRERVVNAAQRARTWPDMERATRLFVETLNRPRQD